MKELFQKNDKLLLFTKETSLFISENNNKGYLSMTISLLYPIL